MNKTLKVVLAVAVIIAIGGSYLFPKVQNIVGSVSGPELISPFWTVDGVRHEYRSTTFTGATSTPCSFISPAATSTLLLTTLQVRTASSTALTWHVATSTEPNATTSLLTLPYSLGSGEQGTMAFTGTTTDATGLVNDANVVPPSTYLTWGFQGVDEYTSDKVIGSCKAEFLVN